MKVTAKGTRMRSYGPAKLVTIELEVESVRAYPARFTIKQDGEWRDLALRPKGNGGWWEVRIPDPERPMLIADGFYAHEIEVT